MTLFNIMTTGALAITLTTAVFAQGEGSQKGERGKHGKSPEMRAKLLERFDTDGDGKLSESERKVAHKAHQERGGGEGKGSEITARILERFDTDGNGQLNAEELKSFLRTMRKRRAEGGKGPEGKGPEGKGPEGKRPEGKRPEGKGPEGKRPDMRAKLLKKFDTDKDGKLSEDERKALREAMKNRRSEGKGRPKGK